MDTTHLLALAMLMAVAAALYSSVGHGGASAYLALMALFGLSNTTMRPTALALNLLVAGVGSIGYARTRNVNWKLLFSFAATAIPAAFLGGTIHLPAEIYRPLVGITLLAAAARLAWRPHIIAAQDVTPPPISTALPLGAAIGLLAGLTGTGGGIFLSPLLLLFKWEEPRRVSGVAALFVLVNSVAGLAGNISSIGHLPAELPVFLAAVSAGALVGVGLGVGRIPRPWLLRLLAVVLLVAGLKMLAG